MSLSGMGKTFPQLCVQGTFHFPISSLAQRRTWIHLILGAVWDQYSQTVLQRKWVIWPVPGKNFSLSLLMKIHVVRCSQMLVFSALCPSFEILYQLFFTSTRNLSRNHFKYCDTMLWSPRFWKKYCFKKACDMWTNQQDKHQNRSI